MSLISIINKVRLLSFLLDLLTVTAAILNSTVLTKIFYGCPGEQMQLSFFSLITLLVN